MISGNYLGVTTLGDIGTNHTELLNAAMPFLLHYMVSHQEHPLNLLAKYFHKEEKSKSDGLTALFYHIIWLRVSSPSELIASNEEHLSNHPEALRRLLSLTSIKTCLPKTMTGCGKLVELHLTMTFPLQAICLREMPKRKPNPISEILPTSKVPSVLARLLHQRQGLIVFL